MEILIRGARELGISLTLAQVKQFDQYYTLLVEWNRRLNLTRIVDYEKVQALHFLDSLSVVLGLEDRAWLHGQDARATAAGQDARATAAGQDARATAAGQDARATASEGGESVFRVIDVGTGAGFPGIPLKIGFPAIQLCLNDSAQKKAVFLKAVVESLGLRDVEVAIGRAEDLGRRADYRERFDLVLSRAVAELATLAELCLPFCRLGGRFIAQKKGDIAEELKQAEVAVRVFGGAPAKLVPVSLEGLADERCLVVIDKIAATPEAYPRRAGMPEKRPIT